ncbi:hypothetical protein [cf. Phormidesmis sp. LEGE 11477]|uniref:hypothetical protein n=1 Tax=cf. Phormidesmis sp. LEGE 11477 TaxID=1828680 RepID=UPI00187FB288|nr:hypothetical protein [cf. Phormidesmis sp. LEGE 11477]MBE9060111.1 hypothetical protein [cf. Phormidesmis sp. LEGE 11477]
MAAAYEISCRGNGQILRGEGRGGIVSLSLNRRFAGGSTYEIRLHPNYFGGDTFNISAYSSNQRRYGRWTAEEISRNQIVLIFEQERSPYVVVSYVLNCG